MRQSASEREVEEVNARESDPPCNEEDEMQCVKFVVVKLMEVSEIGSVVESREGTVTEVSVRMELNDEWERRNEGEDLVNVNSEEEASLMLSVAKCVPSTDPPSISTSDEGSSISSPLSPLCLTEREMSNSVPE